MRSGSTLLKALLGEAPDVSHLPEVNFQRYSERRCTTPQTALDSLSRLSDRPILVLKRPAWYHETRRYPRLPNVPNLKTILLVRDVYETVQSLRRMTFRGLARVVGPCVNSWLASGYWAAITENLTRLADVKQQQTMLIRYEDLTADPVTVTSQLFQWLGSERREGVDAYSEPEDAHWRWGRDDGGSRIRSLRVQPPRAHRYEDQRLVRVILGCDRALKMRQALGYPRLPAS